MQFAGHKRRRHVAVGDPLAEYAGRKTLLHFYNIPPTDNIPLSDFEEVALERLKVLKVFEVAEAKFNNKRSQEYASAVMDDLRKQKLKAFVGRVTDDNGAAIVRKDNLSFFILMLAFCETPAQRRWFTSQEMDLFRFRFQNESAAGIQAFLKDTNMEFTPISADEKAKYFQEIVAASPDMTAAKLDSMDVYKVSFLNVLPLVSDRTVYLRHGEAYVPSEYLITLVESQYRAHLSHMLAQTTRIFHRLEEDERIVPVLRALANFDAGSGFDASRPTDSVSPEMIDQLCKESFPMCMKVMHAALRTNHHLRHGARMQYGLFLKGIGLALQDALRFWREEFSKHVGIENFDKKYSYNIRHNYGTEGKRANYTPYSCNRIISGIPPGPGECHGCPFKHCDRTQLQEKLKAEGVKDGDLKEVMGFVEKGHYQLACTSTFRITQKSPDVTQVICHPNEYYMLSRQFREGSAKDSKFGSLRNIETQKAVVYSQKSGKSVEDFDDNMDDCLEEMLSSAEQKAQEESMMES